MYYNTDNITSPWTGGVFFTFPDYPHRSFFVEFGNGTNDDNISESCDAYIIYGVIEPGKDGELEVAGGMMSYNRATCGYDGDINKAIDDVLEAASNAKTLKPLKRPESFFKHYRNKF